MSESTIQQQIKKMIDDNAVVLFMKGSAGFPQCGFSAVVAQILTQMGVAFKDVDVLLDPEMRQGIKDFSDWPTIPQLYIAGEFIGGCDIVREMYDSGELMTLLQGKALLPLKQAVN